MTFQAICDKTGPEIAKQNTKICDAVPVPKRVAIVPLAPCNWATGDTFRSGPRKDAAHFIGSLSDVTLLCFTSWSTVSFVLFFVSIVF